MDLASHCHCSRCRKAHGTGFATYGGLAADGFRWERGREGVRRWESSPGFHRAFCRRCGAVVPGEPTQERVFVPLGGVDGDPGARPLAHLFVGSKAPWDEIADSLPRFETWPPRFDLPVAADLARPRAAAGKTGGSCLCSGVAFELEGPPLAFRHCHCSRCRKGRAAAHATNLVTALDRFRWLRGEALVTSYKVPEARFFTQAFCRTCGACLPRVDRDRGFAVVPAGALDDDPGARPQVRIFTASRAPWFEIADALPRHDEHVPAG